jgi:hypothetical protein
LNTGIVSLHEDIVVVDEDVVFAGTVAQCKEVLEHVERIIKHYKQLLYKTTPKRTTPQ